MTETEALELIRAAIEVVSPGTGEKVTLETDLTNDEILDSLDRMNFLFELEHMHGSKIEQVTDTFDDFRIATLIGFLSEGKNT